MMGILGRLVLALACLLPCAADALEVHLRDDSLLDANTGPPLGRVPVLFVHGHAIDFAAGADSGTDDPNNPNYKQNWWDGLNGLPSFKQTLDHADNAGLDIEPYYIRFADQGRSITEDARDLGEAVDLIVQRHNPGFNVTAPAAPPPVQVVVVGYSKGTISTRQYLKSLTVQVGDLNQPPLPAPRPNYRPVSDFIAIVPPNHGLAISSFSLTNRTSVQQMYNGVHPDRPPLFPFAPACGTSYGNALATGFMDTLNGHPTADTQNATTGQFVSEAPGFRRDGQGPHAGTLYVTLYAAKVANDPDLVGDMVGGDDPWGDCDGRGRGVARNLAADATGQIAVNIAIPGISGAGALTENLKRLAVHQKTVHVQDVICKALYAAVHHRSPASQSCTIVDNVPIVPLPSRAAAMLALDISGSMLAPACPGCADRLTVLKDSVEIFARLWSMLGRADDRLGATYFRTTVDQFQPADPLPTLANVDAVIDDVRDQQTVPANRTAMGGALQTAIEALVALPQDAASRRHIVLFTDGMQNVNPMVREAMPPGLEISDEPARLSSGVPPSVPPRRLDALPGIGITVDTIGVGTGQAFLDRLAAIAAQAGGLTRATLNAEDLRQFFVEELVESLRGFSPQLVAYRRASLGADGARERFLVENRAGKLLVKLSWPRGRKLDARLFKDGVDLTGAARIASGDFYRIYAFDFPLAQAQAAGSWELRIAGPAGTKYEAAALVDAHTLRYRARLGTGVDRVGAPLALALALGVGGRPVDGPVAVTATLERPAMALGNLLGSLRPGAVAPRGREPGMSVAEQRITALAGDRRYAKALAPIAERIRLDHDGKGGFRAAIADTLVPGLYRVTLRIEGEDSALGKFERTETVAAVVRFAEADRALSAIRLGAIPGGRGAELTLRPRDRYGNLLGPGLANEVRLALDGGRVADGPDDLGDGRYRFRLSWPRGAEPTATLTVAGRPLFKGGLGELRGARAK